MKPIHHARCLLASLLLASLAFSHSVSAATFVVTNLNDSGEGTLRAAITNANASGGLDIITFAINTNTPGVKTITLSSALPAITDPVVIDGATQPGHSNAPLIEINGNFLSSVHGLVIAGGGSTVRALSIRDCGRSTSVATRASGILISTNGGNVVAGCYLGLNPTGLSALQNTADGITLDNSPNNVIGGTNAADRNVISGNSQNGIQILGPGSTNNQVMGNLIGLSAPGTNALGNFNAGILLTNVTGNTIGGTNAGARNVIARNSSFNVLVQNSSGVVIAGNYLGLKPDGTTLSTNPDSANGLSINNSSNNVIGGLTAAARNVIGNLQNGVSIFGSNSVGNVVLGNFIGTGASGTNTVPNSIGVNISSGARSNRVGGTVAGSRNLISGNRSYGVYLNSSNNLVQGNFLGVDITGQAPPLPLPASGSGLNIVASGNVVGGTTPAARNVISGNRGNGIEVGSFSAVLNNIVIQGNYIGTDAGGTLAVSNRNNGIVVFLNTTNCLIGGTNAGAGNVISGNGGNGLWLGASAPVSSVQVIGNRIGFAADLRPTTLASPRPENCCPPPETEVFPDTFFVIPLLNFEHGIRCEHVDNCVFGVPLAPNLISCGNLGDCITIIDGKENDFVNNRFANYGPHQTIDNFAGTQNDIITPLIGQVALNEGHTIVSGICFGAAGTTVTVHLFVEKSGSNERYPTGDKVTVTIGSDSTKPFEFVLPVDSPVSGFSVIAQDAALNTSELAGPLPAVGAASAARFVPQFESTPASISQNSTLDIDVFNAGPATAANTKVQVTFGPGVGGTLTSGYPYIEVPNGIQIDLGPVAPGASVNPDITVQPDPASLRYGVVDILEGSPGFGLGFEKSQISFNPVLPLISNPMIAVGDFAPNPGHPFDDPIVLDPITGNAYVINNPGLPTASVVPLPLETYCADNGLHPTSITPFRGPGGVNHIAVSLTSWPWDANPLGQIVVILNDGAGNFAPKDQFRVINTGPGATSLLNADLNNDGIDDLVWVDPVLNSFTVAVNDGANFFPTQQTQATGGIAPVSAAVGDVNDDDNVDLLVLNQQDGPFQGNLSAVSVYLGTGTGTMTHALWLLDNVTNFGLSIVGGVEKSTVVPSSRPKVDFNNDGFPDFAVLSTRGAPGGSSFTPTVSVLLNRPDAPGQFTVALPIDLVGASIPPFTPGLQSTVPMVAADINSDGRTDLIIGQRGTGCISILLNQGPDGNIIPIFAQSGLGGFGAATGVAVGDVNDDGTPDLLVVNSGRVQLNVSVSTTTTDIAAGLNNLSLPLPVVMDQPYLLLQPDLTQRGLGLVFAPPGPPLKIQVATDLSAPVESRWGDYLLFNNADVLQPFQFNIGSGPGQKFFQGVQGQ